MIGTGQVRANERRMLPLMCFVASLVASQVHGQESVAQLLPATSGQEVLEVPASLRLAADTSAVPFPGSTGASGEAAAAPRDRESVLKDWDAGEEAMFSTSGLQDQIRKLAWGTATVLVLCIGFLVVGKRWFSGKQLVQPTSQLQHLASLQLPNRCTVQLVEADGCRVLVGTDASGVKMIVPLQAAFWEHVDDAPADPTHGAPAAESQTRPNPGGHSPFDLAGVKASFQQLLSSRESSA